MGIVRYSVRCDGCGAAIVLRIGVGIDEEQPFFYVCTNCNAVARGKMLLVGPGTTRLELVGGKLVTEALDSYQVVTLHPDLPSKTTADTLDGQASSSFLLQRDLLGDRFQEFYERLRGFRGAIDENWVAFRRWFDYYLDENREQFDKEGEKLLGKAWNAPRSDCDRHHAVHLALELLTAPLWVGPYFPEMKGDIAKALAAATSAAAPVLRQFAVDHLREVVDLQRRLFHCLELYIDNRSSILPGLAIEMYKNGEEAALRDLRVLRDDFPRLRDLYIATFEAVHDVIDFVMALVNIGERKDPEAFPVDKPRNLEAFSKLVNADKAKSLVSLDAWHRHWPTILDRDVRNAIGHNSIRHDLPSSMLISKGKPPIPYLTFVVKTYRLVHPVLAAETALKYLRMAAT